VGEAVSDGYALQPGDRAVLILCLSQDFLSNRWSVLASVTLAKDDQGVAGLELQLIETASIILKEFLKCIIEIICHTAHVRAINVLKSFVSIPQSRAHRLIDKHHIIVLGPAVIISQNIIGLHVGSN
jgi:hypothetical protein